MEVVIPIECAGDKRRRKESSNRKLVLEYAWRSSSNVLEKDDVHLAFSVISVIYGVTLPGASGFGVT